MRVGSVSECRFSSVITISVWGGKGEVGLWEHTEVFRVIMATGICYTVHHSTVPTTLAPQLALTVPRETPAAGSDRGAGEGKEVVHMGNCPQGTEETGLTREGVTWHAPQDRAWSSDPQSVGPLLNTTRLIW